jgi:hypothetical protein
MKCDFHHQSYCNIKCSNDIILVLDYSFEPKKLRHLCKNAIIYKKEQGARIEIYKLLDDQE